MDANTRPSALSLLRAALIAGTIFLLPTPGDAPMDAAVDDLFSSAPLSVHPSVPSLPPPSVGPEAVDTVAVVIATSVDTFVNVTMTSTGIRLPTFAVEILKDLTGILLDHAIVYCSVVAASVLVAIFVALWRFVTVGPTRLGACSRTLSGRGRQFIYLLWSVLEAIRCHLGRNVLLEDENARLRAELYEVSLHPVMAEAGPAVLKTLEEEYLPLTTTEPQSEACVESQPSIVAFLCLETTNTDTESTKVSDDEQTRMSEKRLKLDKSVLTGTLELDETKPYLVAARQTDKASLQPKTVMLEKEQNDISRETLQVARMEISGLRELVQSLESRLQATVNTLEETTLTKQVMERDMEKIRNETVLAAHNYSVDMTELHEVCHRNRKELDAVISDRKDVYARLSSLKNVNLQQTKKIAQLEYLRTFNRSLERQLSDAKTKLEEEETEAAKAKSTCLVATLRAQTLSKDVERSEARVRHAEDQVMVWQRKARACDDTLKEEKAVVRRERQRAEAAERKLEDAQSELVAAKAQIVESDAKIEELEAQLRKEALEGQDGRRRADVAERELREARTQIDTLSEKLKDEQTKVREVEAQVSESQAKASLLKSAIEDEREKGNSTSLLLEEARRTIGTLSIALTVKQTKVHEVEALVDESQAKASELELAFSKASRRADLAVQELEGAQDKIRSLSTELSEAQTKVPGVGAQLKLSQAKASELEVALAKANRRAELARVKLNTQAKDIETLQRQVTTAQSRLEDETLRADLTAAMFSRSNESFLLLNKSIEEDKRRADDAERKVEETKQYMHKMSEDLEAEKREVAEVAEIEIRRLQQTITVLQASLETETDRGKAAEDKISAIEQERAGLMKGLEEEMRGGYNMTVKFNDADSQAAKAYQERQALEADLDATKVDLSVAQQKVASLSEDSQEMERQLQMTREDNNRLADAMRRAHSDANVAREEVQTISASTRKEVRGLTLKIKFLEKEKMAAERRAKRGHTLSTFHSSNSKQLHRMMKMQQSSAAKSSRQLEARIASETKRANALEAEVKALRKERREQAKLSFELKLQLILAKHRSMGGAARNNHLPATHSTTKTLEAAKTEDDERIALLEHQSIFAPTPDMISPCESALLSFIETRGDVDGMLDRTHATLGGDKSFGAGGLSAFCPPVCPPPGNDPLCGPEPGPDAQEVTPVATSSPEVQAVPLCLLLNMDSDVDLPSLPEMPTCSSVSTILYAVDMGRSCHTIMETSTQSEVESILPPAPPSMPVPIIREYGPHMPDRLPPPDDREPSNLPDLPEMPSYSYTASFTTLETIPAWSPREAVETEAQLSIAEASESVVLLSSSDLPVLPSFPSGSVSSSRSLSQHDAVPSGCAQVQEASTPEASESVVLLSGSVLSDLPSFSSGSVSWSRSLSRTGLVATGIARATDSLVLTRVRSTPDAALSLPSIVFQDSLGSDMGEVVTEACSGPVIYDSPSGLSFSSNTSLTALPTTSPREFLADPRAAARARMEAMLRAQRREQQHCLSPTPVSRGVSLTLEQKADECLSKESEPSSSLLMTRSAVSLAHSEALSSASMEVSESKSRSSMGSGLGLLDLFDSSFSVSTSTPRKHATTCSLEQMALAEPISVEIQQDAETASKSTEFIPMALCSSSPALVLPLPDEVDAYLPEGLVLPSDSVFSMALEESGSKSALLPCLPSLAEVSPEVVHIPMDIGTAPELPIPGKEDSIPLSLTKSLVPPVSEDAPSSSGRSSESDSLEQTPSLFSATSVQTPAAVLASVLVGHMAKRGGDGDMYGEGRIRDARTLMLRKPSLEALQGRRIVSHRIGSRLPGQ